MLTSCHLSPSRTQKGSISGSDEEGTPARKRVASDSDSEAGGPNRSGSEAGSPRRSGGGGAASDDDDDDSGSDRPVKKRRAQRQSDSEEQSDTGSKRGGRSGTDEESRPGSPAAASARGSNAGSDNEGSPRRSDNGSEPARSNRGSDDDSDWGRHTFKVLFYEYDRSVRRRVVGSSCFFFSFFFTGVCFSCRDFCFLSLTLDVDLETFCSRSVY